MITSENVNAFLSRKDQRELLFNSCYEYTFQFQYSFKMFSWWNPRYINKHVGTECEERCRSFALCKSMNESRELMRTHKPVCRETHGNENHSHTPHLYNSTEQLKFLNCHLLKLILDQKIFPLLSLSFTTTEFVFWRPLIASDKKVKPCKQWATERAAVSVAKRLPSERVCEMINVLKENSSRHRTFSQSFKIYLLI